MTELQKQFSDYKGEYSKTGTTDERKQELLVLMQRNLKERSGKDCGTIMCIDGKQYSLDSNNEYDLLKIDGKLNADYSSDKLSESADDARKKAFARNKYGPNNPYPGQ